MASTALARQSVAAAQASAAALAPAALARAADWQSCAAPSMLEAWNALAARAAEPNPFHEAWYLLPALRALDPREAVQMLLCEADGELAGIMPLAEERRYYGKPAPHLAAWLHPNSFLGMPLVAAGREHAFWRSLFAWADSQGGRALFLHLAAVPLDGPVHRALIEVLAEQGRHHGLVHREERAMLASGQSPEDYYAAALSAKKRKELRRQANRLAEQGEIAFRRDTGSRRIGGWIDDFLALEAAGWKGAAGSSMAANGDTADLFRESLRAAAMGGKLERLSLELDGRPVAMLANFIVPPGAFSYKTAYDEALARFSPGVLLQLENLAVLERGDIAWSDSCAAAGHPMIDHIWRERRAIGRYSIAIGGKLRRGLFARLLRLELSRNPTGIAK